MTACSNRKGRAGRVITAALVGALSVGAPAVALATTGGIDVLFADPEGAFSNAEVTAATFKQGGVDGAFTKDAKGVWNCTYAKNKAVTLEDITVSFFDTGATPDFTIDANDPHDDYEVAYYKRGTDGKPTGDKITSDITEVGDYVAEVAAFEGNYKGGKLYVPFTINPVQIFNVTVDGADTVTYNAETHDFNFLFDSIKVYEGIDYTVEYVKTGHDATAPTDVKDAGTYTAKITGKGNYAGTVTLSEPITVEQLDLSKAQITGLLLDTETEPADPYTICIDGRWYGEGDAILDEINADLTNPQDVWFANGRYGYTVKPEKAGDTNIVNSKNFEAYKVAHQLTVNYGTEALPESHDVIMNDAATAWDKDKVSGFAADGTAAGIKVDSSEFKELVYNAKGELQSGTAWMSTPGTYTVFYWAVDASDFNYGGIDMATVNVYEEAINADASAAVLFDTNGDNVKEVVSSVSTVFDASRNLASEIKVVVKDAQGQTVPSSKYAVKYYNADGKEVGKVTNAGTYTLKVTSSDYKLSGTTEMTVTIAPKSLAKVTSKKLVTENFGVGADYTYLPWLANGYGVVKEGDVQGLDLWYFDAEADTEFSMYNKGLYESVKVTIVDSEGKEVKKIESEGVYTLKFSARNADAANNYVLPSDMVITCVKDGNSGSVNHVRFSDVQWDDYFADPVDWVAARDLMNGYKGTKLFGSMDKLNRGQVACILFNMAGADMDETDSDWYSELAGWKSFKDVDGKMYYGEAIAWAKQSGVVNGYDDGTFRPEQPISRQEFAAMLQNYAKKFDNGFKPGDTGSLEGFDDASKVSGWATEAVAWAVDNGILGNGGFLAPTADIVRADAACMVYNYAK